jgi:hypothetical protein
MERIGQQIVAKIDNQVYSSFHSISDVRHNLDISYKKMNKMVEYNTTHPIAEELPAAIRRLVEEKVAAAPEKVWREHVFVNENREPSKCQAFWT